MGLNPLHFNQVHLPGYEAAVCGEPIFQYSWQAADKVGREEIAQAIAEAERAIEDQLMYNLLPTYYVDDRQYLDPRLMRATIKTPFGYFISGGTRSIVSVATGQAIAWSTPDALGYSRNGVVTVAVSFTDPQELGVYYPGHNGEDEWRIEPTSVTIIAGTATITIPRERLLLEELLETLADVESVSGNDDNNFLSEVDISRDYLNPNQQATLLWNNDGPGCSWCICGNGCIPCQHTAQTGCISALDYVNGVIRVTPADWNVTSGQFTSAPVGCVGFPHSVRLWYLAGWRDQSLAWPNRVLDEQWARAVSYLAVTMLDRPICECNALEKITQYYSVDLLEMTESRTFRINTKNDIQNNPVGTTRGAINAWRLIQQRALGQGVVSV
jgi:hypothetical protein